MSAPTDAEVLNALADRCEAATEYDGRLMAEIDCAVRYSSNTRPAEPDDHPTVKDRAFDPSSIWTPTDWLMSHNYFRRLDDAVEMVPEGGKWSITASYGEGRWEAWVWLADGAPPDWREAATPALALTAAALRARAHHLLNQDQPS